MASVFLCLIVLAALVGVGLAAAWWGEGWVWPSTAEAMGPAVRGLLTGRPGDGYETVQASRFASHTATFMGIAVSEAVHLSAALLVGIFLQRKLGLSGARSGMATRSEAEGALGLPQLQAARAIIRPDLHEPTGRRSYARLVSRRDRRS